MTRRSPEEKKRIQDLRRGTPRGRALILWHNAKHRALLNGLPFEITQDWITQQIPKGCAVTGLPFDMRVKKNGARKLPLAPSLDQIRAGQGYVWGNVRVVCVAVNQAAHSWGWPAFERFLRKAGWKKI